MVALLFGIVFTHGVHAESAEGHLVSGVSGPATAATAAAAEAVHLADGQAASRPAVIGEPRAGHGSSHPNEHCVSGQPQQGPVLTPPCFAVSVGESATPGRGSGRWAPGAPVLAVASPTALRLSVVQQV
ncbi:hypothetical protein [Streptomyces sp. S.PB5]|uniref:hypothetical protein n=1 Tax=Streptomyces sp. S.PB5 TaxID=3020844 RepID=UPI0025AF9E84|nr:hypothetical protein [Streptomyces sp. S.PB5]MDN3021409.1 hypothetical protein [Streptomyces sp. S.PB5]